MIPLPPTSLATIYPLTFFFFFPTSHSTVHIHTFYCLYFLLVTIYGCSSIRESFISFWVLLSWYTYEIDFLKLWPLASFPVSAQSSPLRTHWADLSTPWALPEQPEQITEQRVSRWVSILKKVASIKCITLAYQTHVSSPRVPSNRCSFLPSPSPSFAKALASSIWWSIVAIFLLPYRWGKFQIENWPSF